jgi:DNA-binding HxlR family transcriptional regulator
MSNFLGLPAVRTSVLLLTEEPPATVEEKVDRFGIDDSRVYVLSKRRLFGRKWAKIIAAAAEFCREHPEVGLVVVDTLDKFADLDARRSEADTGVIRETIDPLYELLDLGVCVILVTHQRKEEGAYGLRVRGGTALVGSADIIVEIERPADSVGLATATRVVKLVSRFVDAPDEIAVELGPGGWRSLGTVAGAVCRSRREEVLELLGEEPLTAEEIVDAGGLEQARTKTVRRRLNELVEQGLARREGDGKRGSPHRWTLSGNGQEFRDSFRTAHFGLDREKWQQAQC